MEHCRCVVKAVVLFPVPLRFMSTTLRVQLMLMSMTPLQLYAVERDAPIAAPLSALWQWCRPGHACVLSCRLDGTVLVARCSSQQCVYLVSRCPLWHCFRHGRWTTLTFTYPRIDCCGTELGFSNAELSAVTLVMDIGSGAVRHDFYCCFLWSSRQHFEGSGSCGHYF